MPNSKTLSILVVDFYDGLHDLGGAVLDEDSYQKHCSDAQQPPQGGESAASAAPAPTADPFDAPQDLRQMASQAFDTDRQTEYRPETASFVVCVPHESYTEEVEETSSVYVQTDAVYRPDEMSVVIGEPTAETIVQRGSSFFRQRTSGSFHMTSGSFRLSSGSFRMSSYSLRRSASSWHTSFRTSSGSFRTSSGFASGSFYSRMALRAAEADKPYLGSLNWDTEVGGYGLHLI